MRVPNTRDRRGTGENNAMTPMIDVVFLLLIFFVCASVGQVREAILPTELSRGTVGTVEIDETKPWITELRLRLQPDDQGRTVTLLNDRPYDSHDELKTQLLALSDVTPESPVILDIHQSVALGDVIRVYDTCREADFRSIHFAASRRTRSK